MSRTYRTAPVWMETRFKYGDSQYPEDNESHYFNGRYHSIKLDPRSYKVVQYREHIGNTKVMAKRAARRNAKILVKLEAFIIMDEIWQDVQALTWDDYDWYDFRDFDEIGYSDEARDYAEQRRQEEMIYEEEYLDDGYDPYLRDWD